MNTTIYSKSGSSFFQTNNQKLEVYPDLPLGTYLVCFDIKLGFYFENQQDFVLPKKVYGEIKGRAERIIQTFHSRTTSTGVILSGEKGSGKTLLTKKLSLDLAKEGVITLIVNQPYCGDAFNHFIQSISQPAYVLFDEYEKVYSREEDQNALLTLFDGLFTSKKLFAITSNERGRVNSYMLNRPGRFFYAFEYKGLDIAFIREYLSDNLENKDHIESFVRYASTYEAFNFDMLQALVEEMNRYKESVIEAAKYVNVSQTWTRRDEYEVLSFKLKEEVEGFLKVQEKINGGSTFNPFTSGASVYYDVVIKDDEDGSEYNDTETFTINPINIKSFNEDKIVYETSEIIVEIQKVQRESFNVANYFD